MALTRQNARQYVTEYRGKIKALQTRIEAAEAKLSQAKADEMKYTNDRIANQERANKAKLMRDPRRAEEYMEQVKRDTQLVERYGKQIETLTKQIEQYQQQMKADEDMLAKARRLLRSGAIKG